MPFEGGPYVQAACFCDMVVEDKAGVLSLIRVIDTLGTQQIGPNPPREMPPVPHAMKLVIMLKSGRAEGRHDMKILPSLPNGETENAINVSVAFEGDEKGQNLVADFQFIFKYEGLYWFKVYIDDELLTAMPFRVRYNRVITGPTPLPRP